MLRIDGLNILIDACNGNHKVRSVPCANGLQTPWLDVPGGFGLRPEKVDMVLCTPLHADDVGWNTQLQDCHWCRPFPKARYVSARAEYEHLMHASGEGEAFHHEAFLDSVVPVVKSGLAGLVETDHLVHREIGAGIWLEDFHGHSAGLVAIHAERGGWHAMFTGDCFHHPIQMIRPDLHFFADEDGPAAAGQRRKLFDANADRYISLFPAHFRGSVCRTYPERRRCVPFRIHGRRLNALPRING